jgi:hypothetical protein
MVSTSAACRPSEPKRGKNLKLPELETTVTVTSVITVVLPVTLSVRVGAKVIQARALKRVKIQGGKRLMLRDVGPERHDFTVMSTGPKINLTFENTCKDYFKLFLIENLVQEFVNERNRYANSSIVSKRLSLRSVWSAWKDVSYRILVLFSDIYKNGHN